MSDAEPLFRPIEIKSLALKNRIVMSPMGRRGAVNGILSRDYAPYYRRRAEGGVGLIVGEASRIEESMSGATSADSHFFGEEALEAWRHVVDEAHAGGARFMPQLWHVGGVEGDGSLEAKGPPRTPSGLVMPVARSIEQRNVAARRGAPMRTDEIDAVIGAYAKGAGDAKAIGADGVELHAAHGYLIDQFLWRELNRREDKFGRDIRGRARFACEVVRAVRERVGPDFPIQFRFSQWKLQDYRAKLFTTPSELEIFATALVDAGVDIFHCSQRRFWEAEFDGSALNLAGWTKKLSGAVTITVGSVGLDADYFVDIADRMRARADAASQAPEPQERVTGHAAPNSIERLIEQLDAGEFDLVALGRMLIANPSWPKLIRSGRLADMRSYSRELLASIE